MKGLKFVLIPPEAMPAVLSQAFLDCAITLAKTNCQHMTSMKTKQPPLSRRGRTLIRNAFNNVLASSTLRHKIQPSGLPPGHMQSAQMYVLAHRRLLTVST